MNPNPLLENSVLGSKWFNPEYLFNQSIDFFQQVAVFFHNTGAQILAFYQGILFFFSLFFLAVISYTSIRIFEIRRKENKHLKQEIEEYAHHHAEKEKKAQQEEAISKNERWVKTLNYLFSQHPSDWKLAVIEADNMLESLLDQLGFHGENLGDKLKLAGQDSFRNLPSAWEVHTIRNKIAHEGTSFELSQHEAKRVIALFERIFR